MDRTLELPELRMDPHLKGMLRSLWSGQDLILSLLNTSTTIVRSKNAVETRNSPIIISVESCRTLLQSSNSAAANESIYQQAREKNRIT